MTATTHIAAHGPLTHVRTWWYDFRLKHSRRVQQVVFQRLHDSLPLDDPDRYAMEPPALEHALQHLVIDHPDAVTSTDGIGGAA
ncbi:hypothetical protein [Streptomyces beihaiensis]|uniref:Uncharacterized protein n=1 Tax=Streptomyces beihaiensis TaxID=2984495 RepID=A0ABT3TRD5_9ACTN|nr:hypothetical protein [Streptomyces beihaiensis]MCX3059600.1 hypothetical protein [Streptomyces beihaiensis]